MPLKAALNPMWPLRPDVSAPWLEAAARTRGRIRYGTWVASEIKVEQRTTPSAETMASSTRCRSALVRATTRQSMSPAPVMVCTSSTSGIAVSCAATGSWPPAWRISSVMNAVTS